MESAQAKFAIGELCEAFGVTPRALRFYEDERLIAPERRGTSRLYSDRDRARLHLIELFAVVGNDDPRVLKGRQNLASALF